MTKYKLKNTEYSKRLFELIPESVFQQACNECFGDLADSIYMQHVTASGTVTALIPKSSIEQAVEYNPNGWNKFPDVSPIEGKIYMIEERHPGGNKVCFIDRAARNGTFKKPSKAEFYFKEWK